MGKGPADAALSILAAETGQRELAERYREAFTAEVVAKLPLGERFALSRDDVRSWLRTHGHDRPPGGERRRLAAAPPADDDQEPAQDPEALAARARALEERERRVTEREARVDALGVSVGLVAEVTPATWLPAAPVRYQLAALVVDTGDDIEEVGRALGVEPEWTAAVAQGTMTRVDLRHVRLVCEGLRCSPYDLWGTVGARSVAYAYGPDDWPAQTEPLIAVGGAELEPVMEVDDLVPWPPPGGPVGPDFAPEITPELMR